MAAEQRAPHFVRPAYLLEGDMLVLPREPAPVEVDQVWWVEADQEWSVYTACGRLLSFGPWNLLLLTK